MCQVASFLLPHTLQSIDWVAQDEAEDPKRGKKGWEDEEGGAGKRGGWGGMGGLG